MTNNSVYIGVAGGAEMVHFSAYASIMNMTRRDGDSVPTFIQGTKGYEVRQNHFDRFIASDHDYILLLDGDMVFQEDTLERLRSHERPYVSGLYCYRTLNPIRLMWFQPWDGNFPFKPWIDPPERGRLHDIGASGWGCVLIHRDVVMATRGILAGEYDVLEDDMDVWPGTDLVLRGMQRPIIGSDIRYPFYARAAGYQLQGDPDVRPRHLLTYGLSPDDYENQPLERLEATRQLLADMVETVTE